MNLLTSWLDILQHWTGFFLCNVVWNLKDNITQGFNLCKVVPGVIKQHWRRFFSCAMLSKYVWNSIPQENYLCNVGPERTDIVLQESNLRNVVWNMPGPTLHKTITFAMLVLIAQSSQCYLNMSETNVVWNKLLVQCCPMLVPSESVYFGGIYSTIQNW